MTAVTDRRHLLEQACAADSGIRALDFAVTALAVAAGAADGPACSGCMWARIVKPLALPLLGWERGYPPMESPDRTAGLRGGLVNISELMVRMDERAARRTPATSDTERWLRSQEAWDAVVGEWIDRLHAADPAAGHGISFLSGGDS